MSNVIQLNRSDARGAPRDPKSKKQMPKPKWHFSVLAGSSIRTARLISNYPTFHEALECYEMLPSQFKVICRVTTTYLLDNRDEPTP